MSAPAGAAAHAAERTGSPLRRPPFMLSSPAMDRILVKVSRPHAYATGEARACLERLMDAIAERFPGYNLKTEWDDDRKLRSTFTFEKAGKGAGGGSAALAGGRVDIELDAQYNLPFFVPIRVAEKIVRDELSRALDTTFGPSP